MPTLSTTELAKLSHALGRALAVDGVNQLGRDTGQPQRLRTVTRDVLLQVATHPQHRISELTPKG